MKNKNNKVYVICYDTLDVFNTREEAKRFYKYCYYSSEGAEHERYASILIDLDDKDIAKDDVSIDCKTISIKTDKNAFIKLELEEFLPIKDTINYYEKNIQPIIDVSKEYDIDFNSKIPFQDYGSDEESGYMCSFTNFYKEILKNMNIENVNISTEEVSAGKYKIILSNNEVDITAWDKLDSVINNINTIKEILNNKDIEMEK